MRQSSTTHRTLAYLHSTCNRCASSAHAYVHNVKAWAFFTPPTATEFAAPFILALSVREVVGRRAPSTWARTPVELASIDSDIVRLAFDAELILRERTAPAYLLLPRTENDEAIVRRAGGTVTEHFVDPVVIHTSTPDE